MKYRECVVMIELERLRIDTQNQFSRTSLDISKVGKLKDIVTTVAEIFLKNRTKV